MSKTARARYTLKFKQEAVRLVEGGQSIAAAEYGITSSMSRKGNCWDNACSESLFGSLKVERLHGQHFKSRRQARDETIAWLLWYNRTRLHSTLAYVSPMQFEQNWLVHQSRQANS
jgi:transposase InsO family protein